MDEIFDEMSEQLAQQMISMMKKFAEPECTDSMAKFYRGLYLSLVKEGFGTEEAMEIVKNASVKGSK